MADAEFIKVISEILDPGREIHIDEEGNIGRAYLAKKIAKFIDKYVDMVIGEDEVLHKERAWDQQVRNVLRAEQRQRARVNATYPHAFGCEKFDDGKCNCGYEKAF